MWSKRVRLCHTCRLITVVTSKTDEFASRQHVTYDVRTPEVMVWIGDGLVASCKTRGRIEFYQKCGGPDGDGTNKTHGTGDDRLTAARTAQAGCSQDVFSCAN